MIQTFELQPVDTLFFRDARPMQAGAGSGGHGANWPLPTTLHEALRTMLLRESGLLPAEYSCNGWRKRNKDGNLTAIRIGYCTRAFESLRIVGPLPVRNKRMHFPAPLDLAPVEGSDWAVMRPLASSPGDANFPAGWLRPVAAKTRAEKASLYPSWITIECFIRYLAATENLEIPREPALLYSEPRIGIGIDPTSRAATEGKLFASEHLRFDDGVGVWVEASLSSSDSAVKDTGYDLKKCFGKVFTFGGESRMCRILEGADPGLKNIPRPQGTLIKWVAVTPALFMDGWRPNWIRKEDGAVLLKEGNIERLPNENRLAWRERIRKLPHLEAKLIAVRTSGFRCFSGWDLNLKNNSNGKVSSGGPKATVFAIPAGSVYYFKAKTNEAAGHLVQALHGRTLSDFFGEKGMGLGFCGRWEPLI
ncbi:MAG TPA: type III-B CRISPR module-associated Cmr3 family protein [Acidobacteriota bacterium]|nr:type III-B CRISPR module-associated Cmr3 family protein [Acidobacteriota bacterium]